jgi:adenosylcobinamide-GDP ribazoletransferase
VRPGLNGLLGAVQFLTRLPVPGGDYRLEAAVVWLPLVGCLLGAVLAMVDWAMRWLQAPALLASTVVVVLLLMLTGALHVDGLMDTCDAVLVHATPERRLEIMRDPRVGAFGVAGLVSVIVLKIASVDALADAIRPFLLILAPGLGRWAIVLVASLFPYGRKNGLGAPLKAAATPRALVVASLVPLVGCVLVWPAGIIGAAVGALLALALGRWLMRQLPGLTGDCYGAVCEVVETGVWLSAALTWPRGVAA